jgi:pSer/pThr/pTyr-binding forkhead associated (FHA) protein
MSEYQPNPQKLSKFVYIIIDEQIYPLDKTIISIGRKLENDLVINNNFVSRRHAEIRYENGEFFIYDLGSTSGTFVNNQRVEKSILYSGDHITLANVPLVFIYEGGPPESDLDETTGKIGR